MGKKLIITEKPSVAQDYAKVFGVSGRNNGYIENDTYVITWCVGHLVEMVYPRNTTSNTKMGAERPAVSARNIQIRRDCKRKAAVSNRQ